MKKLLILLPLILIALMAVFTGCGNNNGSNKQTIETEEGSVTVEEKTDQGLESYEVEMGSTKVDVGQEKQPTADELGIPIYDGAEYVPGSGKMATVSNDDTPVNMIAGEFTTADPLNKVEDWYGGKLGNPGINTPEEIAWIFRNDAGDVRAVSLKTEESKVKITIYRVSKSSS